MAVTLVPTRKPLNRWAILSASCAVLFLGGVVYSFSVLRDPLVDAKGFSLSTVLLAFSINSGIAPLPMTLGGWLTDRGYARWLAGVGGALIGLGWFLAGISANPVMLIIGYGVVSGMGQGLAYSACLHNNMRLFPDKRGMAAGLSIGANGAASILVAPLARALIDQVGVERTMSMLGISFAVVAVCAVGIIRAAPPGYQPEGWTPTDTGEPPEADGLTWRQMVVTSAFYATFLLFVCGAFSGLMIAANASPIGVAMYGLSTSTAALFVSLYAASKMTGGVVFGSISDRLGAVRTIMVVFAVIAASLVALVLARGNSAGFAIGLIGLGLCFGGVMGVMPSIVSTTFGRRHQGVNYGIVFSAYSVASLFSPNLAANIGESSGDYTPAFLIAVAAAGLGLGLTVVLARLTNRTKSTA